MKDNAKTLDKIVGETKSFIESISTAAFERGVQHERKRIGMMLQRLSAELHSAEPKRMEEPAEDAPKKRKYTRRYKRKNNFKLAPQFHRVGTEYCMREIRACMDDPDSIITTREALRRCANIGVKSHPVVWLALRRLVKDGFIERVRSGLYQRVKKADLTMIPS